MSGTPRNAGLETLIIDREDCSERDTWRSQLLIVRLPPFGPGDNGRVDHYPVFTLSRFVSGLCQLASRTDV